MVISSVSLILGEVIGRFLFLVDVVVRGDVSMFSILADWLICRLGIVLVGVVRFSKNSGFAAVGLGFVLVEVASMDCVMIEVGINGVFALIGGKAFVGNFSCASTGCIVFT